MKPRRKAKVVTTPVITGRSHQVTARLPLELYERLLAYQEQRQAALPALAYGSPASITKCHQRQLHRAIQVHLDRVVVVVVRQVVVVASPRFWAASARTLLPVRSTITA